MNALKYYNLTSLPKQQKSVERPLKQLKLSQPQKSEKVGYICYDCHEMVFLDANDSVQCQNCRSRIVRKVENNSEKRKYSAV